ncbi:type 2 periplasmic-binding domain-containing protein [Caballeronia catudaia]|uniref:hypothetical protein n=1 Tax=Caballeronia catudaia TaxID=1777136 RepID=UPI0007723F84|nr:hypothetical protein [Caballeronia catudaia]
MPASAREWCFGEVAYRPLWTQDAHADIDLAWSEEQTNPAVDNVRRFAIEHFARIAKRAPETS